MIRLLSYLMLKYVDSAVSIQINQYYLEVLFIQYEYTRINIIYIITYYNCYFLQTSHALMFNRIILNKKLKFCIKTFLIEKTLFIVFFLIT